MTANLSPSMLQVVVTVQRGNDLSLQIRTMWHEKRRYDLGRGQGKVEIGKVWEARLAAKPG